jgi:hypothetical protein
VVYFRISRIKDRISSLFNERNARSGYGNPSRSIIIINKVTTSKPNRFADGSKSEKHPTRQVKAAPKKEATLFLLSY